ncbi:unnamed protein product, partial [Ixodes pacificus]
SSDHRGRWFLLGRLEGNVFPFQHLEPVSTTANLPLLSTVRVFTPAAGQIIVAQGCQRKSCPRKCWRRGGAPRPGAAAKVVHYSSSTQRQISEGEEYRLLSWRDQLRDCREQPAHQQKPEPLQPNPASGSTLSPTARPFSVAI